MTIQTMISSYTPRHWKYDVFLSFRGEDTRKKFTDHLYAALNQKGIHIFRDDKELERGERISPGLLQAIEESRYSIIVFSRNYASSTWCLDELVKIIECMNTRGQIVIPVFYDVDPSVLRTQTGEFQEAFAKHEESFRETIETVKQWRSALQEVANLCGWDARDRYESEFVQEIVKRISSKLSHSSMNPQDLVGIDSHLEKLKKLIDVKSNDVRMIGIWGMGGIGKTTIARVVYESISCEFKSCSFLANVREISQKNGLISLQMILLSQIQKIRMDEMNIHNVYDGICMIRSRLKHKKVLVIIDDVVHKNQLTALVGKHDWFGLGSRIIITTRDKRLLMMHGVDEVYEVEELNDDDSVQLFSLKAFKNYHVPKDYMELSKRFVKYAGGLPLALEVLGSFLFGRSINEWRNEIERLDRDPENEILDILQISFDGLKETEKKIFLYIACFFNGNDRDYVTRILEGCGFYPTIGIVVLMDKSLITISKENKLWMHDLLQEMGQQIVKRKPFEEPGKRSLMWEEANIHHVLTKDMGTEVVEGMNIEKKLHLSVRTKAFSKMIKLRLLNVHNTQLPALTTGLQLLEGHGNPLKFLPSNSQSDKIVELQLDFSCMQQLWKGIIPLNTLTSITLKDCQNLDEIPDITWATNLEALFLEGCPSLHGIYSPFLVHKKLAYLGVSNCTNLTTLPTKIYMESLEKLEIFGCPKVKKFSEIGGRMENLRFFRIDGTAIEDMPLSIELLTGLEDLILTNNKNLTTLPHAISHLKSLKFLDISGCSKLENVSETLGEVESFEQLDLKVTAITQLE